jgi:hypothetical protein
MSIAYVHDETQPLKTSAPDSGQRFQRLRKNSQRWSFQRARLPSRAVKSLKAMFGVA